MQDPKDYLAQLKNKLTEEQEKNGSEGAPEAGKLQPEQLEQRMMFSGSQYAEALDAPEQMDVAPVDNMPIQDFMPVDGQGNGDLLADAPKPQPSNGIIHGTDGADNLTGGQGNDFTKGYGCLLYTSPSPRD